MVSGWATARPRRSSPTSSRVVRIRRVPRALAALAVAAAAGIGLLVWALTRGEERKPAPTAAVPALPPRPPAPLTWTQNRDAISFRNDDGVWSISTGCVDQTRSGFRRSVGPGYIAWMRDARGRKLVADFRPRRDLWSPGYLNSVNGGLGTFGFHYVRGRPGRTPAGDDPTTRRKESGVDHEPPGFAVEGRMCRRTNGGFGVYRVAWDGPRRVQDTVEYRFDVFLRDPVAPLARVRYRYRFTATKVEVWVAVRTEPYDPGGRVPLVKEPKLVATLRGGGYRRMSVIGADGEFEKGVLVGAPEGTPVLRTGHAADANRVRVRFDYGRSATVEGADPCGEAPCFDVVMEAYPTTPDGDALPGQEPLPWENPSGVGFDGWAVASSQRPSAWPSDTHGAEVVSGCGAQPRGARTPAEYARASADASPALDSVRRWELGGWKNRNPADPIDNPNRYTAAETSFIAWEGGRGPGDCEPLERALAPAGESWGAYAAFRLSR